MATISTESRDARTTALKSAREDWTTLGKDVPDDASEVVKRAETYRAFLEGDNVTDP